MADVRILPEVISNKIAAGEVVERPVSVVKELLENALDAGATRITIEIEQGGRRLVRISDNGEGMNKDNALLAIERYATSKIASDTDLFSVKSFGFRGEALPSIASVSKMVIVTREKKAGSGTRIYIKGGRLMDVSDTGAPPGTMVEVRDLYFNTPARQKFLKTINTEMGHIADVFQGTALGNPGVAFKLVHNKREVNHFSSSDNFFQRTVEVFGRESSRGLCPLCLAENTCNVSGYISEPSMTRSASQRIKIFVNNRMVSDRGVVAALLRGYKGRIMKGRYPFGAVFLTLPFDRVDVNVHPAKREVRFIDAGRVYNTLTCAVEKALEDFDKNTQRIEISDDTDRADRASDLFQWRRPQKNSFSVSEGLPVSEIPLPESEAVFQSPHPAPERCSRSDPEAFNSGLNTKSDYTTNPYEPPPSGEVQEQDEPLSSGGAQDRSVPEEKQGATPLPFFIVGQIFGTYIAVQSDNEFVFVDQHAAHERIIYEKLKKRARSFSPPSQGLVVPETIEMNFQEAALLERILPDLNDLGFEIELFGDKTFIIKAIPAIIEDKAVKPLLAEMVETILASGLDGDDDESREKWLDEVLILMSCHNAIRANHTMNLSEMQALIRDLEQCDIPGYCPHGRPTRISWSRREIEKQFKRIV